MKKHEITTSKGEFVAVDIPSYVVEFTANKSTFKIGETRCKLICKLSEATEEDAELIVDKSEAFQVYRNYVKTVEFGNKMEFTFPLDSLHSLLKSKGIDLNNGNWYLFKKI